MAQPDQTLRIFRPKRVTCGQLDRKKSRPRKESALNTWYGDLQVGVLLGPVGHGGNDAQGDDFVAHLHQVFVGGVQGSHFFGRTQEAGQALGQKNTAFAIWLSVAYLNPLSSVGPGCYILWQNIVNSIEIWQKRREEK